MNTIEFPNPICKSIKYIPKPEKENPYKGFRIHACPLCGKVPTIEIHRELSQYKRFRVRSNPECECCGLLPIRGDYGYHHRLEWLLDLYYSRIGLYLVSHCNYSWDDVNDWSDGWDWHDYYSLGDYYL